MGGDENFERLKFRLAEVLSMTVNKDPNVERPILQELH